MTNDINEYEILTYGLVSCILFFGIINTKKFLGHGSMSEYTKNIIY